MKHYMVIERFRPDCRERVYERLYRDGRLLPEGLYYLDSWLVKDGDRCFQLMATKDVALFEQWIEGWSDLVEFEVLEIEPRSDTAHQP